MSRVRPPSPAPVFCPPAWSAPDGHFPAGTLTYGAGARYPSGKGEVCKNPFDSIVLTALSSVFSSKIPLLDPDSLLKSCSNFRCPTTPPTRRPEESCIAQDAQFTVALPQHFLYFFP